MARYRMRQTKDGTWSVSARLSLRGGKDTAIARRVVSADGLKTAVEELSTEVDIVRNPMKYQQRQLQYVTEEDPEWQA